jgi:hypothetical protein
MADKPKASKPAVDKNIQIIIAGAGGFIGGALARYFRARGFTRIRAIDKKPLGEWYQRVPGVECLCLDLSLEKNCRRAVEGADEIYQLAADMGGMGFIERFRIECLRSVLINTHMIESACRAGVDRYFYSSSACVYNTDLQKDPNVRALKESDAYPAMAERGILGRTRDEDVHRPVPQRLRPVGHVGRRPGEGAGGPLPQGHRRQGQRRLEHQHLGRRDGDPELHVYR